MHESQELYIDYCLDISRRSHLKVSPNPMVGALIVHNGIIVSEGWHKEFGGPHAEVEAINNIPAQAKHLLKEATLFVSLEPCNHHGKTKPCTDLIIQSGIPHVVIAALDPNPIMSGKSVQILLNAGIKVEGPIAQHKWENINHTFRQNILKKRPYIVLKWAQSQDGFLSETNGATKISNIYSDILVHKWRNESDGILIGRRTLEIDNPKLNNRLWVGKDPKKFVLGSLKQQNLKNFKISDNPPFPLILDSDIPIKQSLFDLYLNQNIGVLLVEGGLQLLSSLIEANLWDEARVITNSNLEIEKGLMAPVAKGKCISKFVLENDSICILTNNKAV